MRKAYAEVGADKANQALIRPGLVDNKSDVANALYEEHLKDRTGIFRIYGPLELFFDQTGS
jgi:hypothetical protein